MKKIEMTVLEASETHLTAEVQIFATKNHSVLELENAGQLQVIVEPGIISLYPISETEAYLPTLTEKERNFIRTLATTYWQGFKNNQTIWHWMEED